MKHEEFEIGDLIYPINFLDLCSNHAKDQFRPELIGEIIHIEESHSIVVREDPLRVFPTTKIHIVKLDSGEILTDQIYKFIGLEEYLEKIRIDLEKLKILYDFISSSLDQRNKETSCSS